ncbi:MAG TPA: adenylate/guanylate cyclase domain-containing protein [Candidatus Omnitrophota bacterium]|nr:adenylate/guanylate cyclase domain-containing protein [Candidatus Omnitrophota bacterium]HPS37215.1 adenylate/guanylate cyclase domain-containing protein [Candidatus Omnitrophota bacterium]
MRKIASYLVPLLILFCIFAFLRQFPVQTEGLRVKIFDLYQQIRPRQYQETPVRIIDIDDESLSKLGQWPWPRNLLAKLVTRLSRGGAKSIVFDGVFAEADRTSPRNIIPTWPDDPILTLVRSEIDKIPDHDEVFAKAITKAPVVLAFGLINQRNSKLPVMKTGFLEHGMRQDKAIDYIEPIYKGAVVNLPALEKASRGNGCFNMGADRDSVVRRVPALFRLNDILYPSLLLEALRVFQEASTYKISLAGSTGEASFGEKTGLVNIKTGLIDIPTEGNGQIWLYDTGYKPERYIPAWKVLSDNFDLKSLEGRVLFIGSSALGLKDLRPTPVNSRAAGVDVHAQIAEQIFTGEFLERPDWAEGAEYTYLALLGLLLTFLLPHAGAIRSAVIGLLGTAAAVGVSWYVFDKWHFLTDPVFPSLAVLMIYMASSFLNFLGTEKERGAIRGAFGRYLSPVLVEKLAKNPKQLKLGGEMRVMSFLFMDIRNFTTIAEQFKPEELTQFMNRFLTPMTDIILKHGGTIDKYIGDCIMAFWNAPLEDKDHARHACEAALDMQDLIRQWNQESEKGDPLYPHIQIGIGINTGNACVGNMGSEQRFDYTVLGDSVNLASRLESLSKNYGVTTVLGQNTVANAGGFATLELDLIRVKGKTHPTQIFALLGDTALAQTPDFAKLAVEHGKMLASYRGQRWEEARGFLDPCRKIPVRGIDLTALCDLYASRIQASRINPPGQDWDGAATASAK